LNSIVSSATKYISALKLQLNAHYGRLEMHLAKMLTDENNTGHTNKKYPLQSLADNSS